MESKPLVVVGAGVSGTAAAIEAARAGVRVTLIDENPISTSMVGLNVPQFFGQRFMGALRDKALMLERGDCGQQKLWRRLKKPAVDVQLGTCVWGAFRNSETSRVLDGPQLGLADDERSWLMKYDRLIVAAGARDLGISFAGWNLAGAMGANGAYVLMNRYQASSSRRMVVMGSGKPGPQTPPGWRWPGVSRYAAVVEVSSSIRGDEALITALQSEGVQLYTSHTVREAVGRDGDIQSVVLVEIDDDSEPVAGHREGYLRRHRLPRHRPGSQRGAPQSPGVRPHLRVRAWRVRAGPRRLDANQRRYRVCRGGCRRLPRRNGPRHRDCTKPRPPGRSRRCRVARCYRQGRSARPEKRPPGSGRRLNTERGALELEELASVPRERRRVVSSRARARRLPVLSSSTYGRHGIWTGIGANEPPESHNAREGLSSQPRPGQAPDKGGNGPLPGPALS